MINIYIPQNFSLFYFDFLVFSLAFLLLIDKTICYVFRNSNNSNNLIKLFGSHEKHNIEFSCNMIIFLFIVSILPKTIEYLL